MPDRRPENQKNVLANMSEAIWEQQRGKKCQKISGNRRGEKYGKMMKTRNCGQKKKQN